MRQNREPKRNNRQHRQFLGKVQRLTENSTSNFISGNKSIARIRLQQELVLALKNLKLKIISITLRGSATNIRQQKQAL